MKVPIAYQKWLIGSVSDGAKFTGQRRVLNKEPALPFVSVTTTAPFG